jgi:hypothetical protein
MKDMRQGQVSGTGSLPGWPFLASALILLVVLIVPIINGPRVDVFGFLERYAGVVVLVSLSNAVMFGLACTDRLILTIRFRVALQLIHRAMAFIGVGFLFVHVVTKVIASKAAALEGVVPFINSIPVGLGTVAGYMMVLIMGIGVLRVRFHAKPWVWRVLHSTAYICWPIGLVHGLTAGRPGALWVILSYAACLVAVGLGLLIRFMFSTRRMRNFSQVPAAGPRAATPRRPGAAYNTGPQALVGGEGAVDAEFWASLRREVRR